MTSRTRLWVLLISTPVIAFAIIGGYLGQAMTKDDTYQHLRVFEDVVSLVINNYVEPVDVNQAMKGAMRGLAEGLDPESDRSTRTDFVRRVSLALGDMQRKGRAEKIVVEALRSHRQKLEPAAS